ncbi:MAG TPA: hypothetical protein VMA09_05250 [Candidatus Binataceae bacterium]|nr:hypothetical protein [Candidatus Binataceae bacterium]
MKKTRENQKKLQSFADLHQTNRNIDPETLDRSLDILLKATDDISRELDKLLAKAKGQNCPNVTLLRPKTRRPRAACARGLLRLQICSMLTRLGASARGCRSL